MADLDRLLKLTIRAPRDLSNPTQVPDVAFEGNVWAFYSDGGAGTELTVGGVLIVQYRDYLIRWRADLLDYFLPDLGIEDDDGDSWTAQRISEPGTRRRYMQIQCTRATRDG